MSLWVGAVVVALIAANAFYVAAEFAAVGVRRSRVRRLSDDGSVLAKRLLPHVDDSAALDTYVGTSQIGITVSSLLLGAYAQATVGSSLAPLFQSLFGLLPLAAVSVSQIVVLVTLTSVQLVLGELVPKALALQYPTETALATVLPMRWSLVLFNPFIWVLNGTALTFLRLLGARHQAHRHLHSPDEIDLLIAESRDGGLLEPVEQQRLQSALHLGTRRARDLMVPLERVTMVDAGASWDTVLDLVRLSPFSRLPVYQHARTHVIGVLRVRDVVDRYARQHQPLAVMRLLRPVVSLPEDIAADEALAALRAGRVHAAVLVDQEQRAIGLLTVQDVLAELLRMEPARPTDGGPAS